MRHGLLEVFRTSLNWIQNMTLRKRCVSYNLFMAGLTRKLQFYNTPPQSQRTNRPENFVCLHDSCGMSFTTKYLLKCAS